MLSLLLLIHQRKDCVTGFFTATDGADETVNNTPPGRRICELLVKEMEHMVYKGKKIHILYLK